MTRHLCMISRVKHCATNQNGLAAVEFAMLLPLMITLFFGVVEASLALLCRADVSIMASTAADLISQADTIAASDISNVYSAAGTILYPYYDPSKSGSAKPTIRITSVLYNASDTTTGLVDWSCTQTGSGALSPASRAHNDKVTMPTGLLYSGGSVIMTEIAYSYASPTSKVVAGTINFTNNWYTRPRRVLQIPAPTNGCP